MVGQVGEKFVNSFLSRKLRDGKIERYEWTSRVNAVEAFDFRVDESILIDVKSTSYGFQQKLHISLNELLYMRAEPYHLYRIYDVRACQAKLRICKSLHEFAVRAISVFETLPYGVKVDSISISPSCLEFGEEIIIDIAEDPSID